jgi:hypothetical protein
LGFEVEFRECVSAVVEGAAGSGAVVAREMGADQEPVCWLAAGLGGDGALGGVVSVVGLP